MAVLLGLLGLSSDLLGCLKGAVSHCAFMTELVGILQSVMKTSFIPEQRVSDTHTHTQLHWLCSCVGHGTSVGVSFSVSFLSFFLSFFFLFLSFTGPGCCHSAD